ncbi:hypothetical protein BA768_10395 [Chryseobacterium sp. CBo1]|uniref:hypothetical protein n=1 Tax=Chryseobacterium sp. CBo1 TaxID=1869230 RepID=UPI000810CAC4|nr:hypothetical protein [Chryseobacterium sp. CBo1]OCK52780.1 hypothetical protein BA768_10395 [Chryseobacterium sp. CBo1]
MKTKILHLTALCFILFSCKKNDNEEKITTDNTPKIEVETNKELSFYSDSIFTNIKPNVLDKVGDAIFVSAINPSDTLQIKEEISKRDSILLKDVSFGGCCMHSDAYSKIYIPEDDKYVYFSIKGKDLKFNLISGASPYYGDSFDKNTTAIYKDQNANRYLICTFNTDKINLQYIENDKSHFAQLYPLAGTD